MKTELQKTLMDKGVCGRYIVLVLVNCLIQCVVFGFAKSGFSHEYSVPENQKRSVWRIETEHNTWGSGFVLSDSLAGFFLVTNKHVVMDTVRGSYFDSVRVYANTITATDKVKSSTKYHVLYLRNEGRDLFVEHEDPNVDLVFIRLSHRDRRIFNPRGIVKLIAWSTSMVLDTRNSTINDGARVQMLGYSQRLKQRSQFPLSRFGFIASFPKESTRIAIGGELKESQWIIVDATTRGGQSGGPVFVAIIETKQLWLVGFSQASKESDELSLVIPSHYILDLLDQLRATSADD